MTPQLKSVSVLLFDEFHERHLLRRHHARAARLDVQEKFAAGFGSWRSCRPRLMQILLAPISQGRACSLPKGRMFPVEIKIRPRTRVIRISAPIWEQAADAFQPFMVNSGGQGDVLVFYCRGGFEISQTIEAIRPHGRSEGFLFLLPLHGELPPEGPGCCSGALSRRRKVVVFNQCRRKTSLTIDGVRLVIDSGLARIPRFDANRGIKHLARRKYFRKPTPTSAPGRARTYCSGRVREAVVAPTNIRTRPAQELPEIKRLDLAEVVLTLKARLASRTCVNSRWLEAPDEVSLAHCRGIADGPWRSR